MGNDNLLYLVRCVPSRQKYVEKMKSQIPGLVIYNDTDGNAMKSFIKSLRLIGNRAAIILEDDVELTSHFCEKAEEVMRKHPQSFITFFHLSKVNLTSRWEPGSKFCMAQCIYIPEGYATQIADYYPKWTRKEEHPTGTDLMIADWLKSRKEKYYIHCPSLVQHLPIVSVINNRRSKFRQSATYKP